MYLPFWFGAIFLGLNGKDAEWGPIVLFLVTAIVLTSIAEFANKYADRDEDWLYWPSNPLVTGELDAADARRALILQNVVAGALVIALLVVTLNASLVVALVVGWLTALTYSVPPFRFKETPAGPLVVALGDALLPVVAWLIVAPADSFIAAFGAFCFVFTFGVGITVKFRKTFHALNHGLITSKRGSNIYNLSTVGFKLNVKGSMVLEAIAALGAFVLVAVFWYLGIFDMPLSIALLTVPLALTVLAVGLRIKDPLGNGPKCAVLMGAAWIFIILSLFVVALTSLLPWGLIVLACIAYAIGGPLLFRTIHPFRLSAVKAPWEGM